MAKLTINKITEKLEEINKRTISHFGEYAVSWLRNVIDNKQWHGVYNRKELMELFDEIAYDYNYYLEDESETRRDFLLSDLDEIKLNLVKEIMPTWIDKSNTYVNLEWLVDHYDLKLDELYFDGDGNCIRDEEGNIWWS